LRARDASYYAEPDRGAEKAYALFYRALVETGCVAIGELVMYGREYAVCIRPGTRGLVLHTLFYGDEVRVADEAPADLGLVGEKALELAKMLVNAQKGSFDPQKLKDKFRQRVLEVVASRTQCSGLDCRPATGIRAGGGHHGCTASKPGCGAETAAERGHERRSTEEGQAAGGAADFVLVPPRSARVRARRTKFRSHVRRTPVRERDSGPGCEHGRNAVLRRGMACG
jgi:hypothetical protein